MQVRYSDIELFGHHYKKYIEALDSLDRTPREFMGYCIELLDDLISVSTQDIDWMEADKAQLRNYRMKAIQFYDLKRRT